MHSLDDMALFVEVVKAKGFTRASEQLGMPTSTLSVRINKLEKNLGLQLLNRTTRRVELTEVGQLYFQRALHIIEESKALHHQLDEMLNYPSGFVRISMPVDFAYQAFAPLVPLFYQAFPHIRLDIDTTPRKIDLISEPFDVAIRVGENQDSMLVARLLTTYPFRLYASNTYLATHGTPHSLDELKEHHCLAFRQASWELFDGQEKCTIAFDSRIICQSLGLLERLVRQDMGIALLPDVAVADKSLVNILPNWTGQSMPLYALTSTRLLPKKVQVFIEFLKEHLAK